MQSATNIFTIIADAPSTIEIPAGTNIVILDGYANKLANTSIVPSVIIGDFDEISPTALEHFKGLGVKIIKDDCQNSTDLDKAIKYCDSQHAQEIHIYNALGGRLDHTLYNTRILKKYYNPSRRIRLFNEGEILEYFTDCNITINGKAEQGIAILSAPKATVTSSGLKYDMQSLQLEFGKSESSCNSLASNTATICIKGSAFVVYNKLTNISYY